jgi:hypothetical protein
MEEHAVKIVNNCWNIKITCYLETFYNQMLFDFLTIYQIIYLWQLKRNSFLHRYLILAVLLGEFRTVQDTPMFLCIRHCCSFASRSPSRVHFCKTLHALKALRPIMISRSILDQQSSTLLWLQLIELKPHNRKIV